jgi:triacylglycerol lipase
MIRTEAITASGPCHNRKTYVPRSPYRSGFTSVFRPFATQTPIIASFRAVVRIPVLRYALEKFFCVCHRLSIYPIIIMYLPHAFVVDEAVACGKLIDQAYKQFDLTKESLPWTIQDGYKLEKDFFAVEDLANLPLDFIHLRGGTKPIPFGFIASKDDAVYVVIRGTQTPLEWFDNASIKPISFNAGWGNTTNGFLRLHRQIFPKILEFFSGRQAPLGRLFITGHSLGAALANLVAADLAFNQLLKKDATKVYTFSGPRVGDSSFAAKFREHLGLSAWRVFNTEDLVPTLPLATTELDPRSKLGLFESRIELLLKLILTETPLLFQHVDEPVAVTYQRNTIPDNHNLTFLYQHLSTEVNLSPKVPLQ